MPLSVSAGADAWIHDFVHSDDPRFAGKSKKKRIQMALAAYYTKKRGESTLLRNAATLLELDTIHNPTPMGGQNAPPQSRFVTGGTPMNMGMTSPAMSTQAIMSQPGSSSVAPATLPSNAVTTGSVMGAQSGSMAPVTGVNTTSSPQTTSPDLSNITRQARSSIGMGDSRKSFEAILTRIAEKHRLSA